MSDVVQRHGEAPLREELPRRVDDALPVSLGVLAKSCFATHSPSLAPKRIPSVHLDRSYLLMILSSLEADNHRPLRSHGLQTSRTNLDHHARWTPAEQLLLVVLGGVVFLDTLDLSLVQVALPSIGSQLHLPEGQLQWIVSAFVLGYGGFLLFGGRCADVLGRKRVLVGGLVALIAASVLGAAATDGTLLIVARFVKGVTAAFTAPAALSILTTSFGEGHRRNRALGVYAAAAAAGFTFGLVAGGLLTQLSWRYTFAVVAPVALVLLVAAVRVVRPDPVASDNRRRLDVAGALTVTAALLLFPWAIVEAPLAGWTSPRTLGAIGASALLGALFFAIENRVAQPL